MKIGFTSDIHIDINKAYNVTKALLTLCNEENLSYLVIGGDLFNDVSRIPYFLENFKGTKTQVRFILGNHDYWTYPDSKTSFEISNMFNDIPEYLPVNNIETKDSVILGNTGWYDYSFAPTTYTYERLDRMRYSTREWPDRTYCNWEGFNNLAVTDYFLNDIENQLIAASFLKKDIYVITHMVPHDNFIMKRPDVDGWDYCNAFFGTQKLHELYKKYNVKIGLFGHTHFSWNGNVDGIDYKSVPLGYSFEFDWDRKTPLDIAIRKNLYILETN